MTVVVVKSDKYERNRLKDLLDMLNPEVEEKKVLIKVNAVGPHRPEQAVTTHPLLISSLIDFLREGGVEDIVIADSPFAGADPVEVFRETGLFALARKKEVKLLDLNKAERVNFAWEYGELSLPKIAFERYYINFAKLKTHIQTTVSLGLKNQKGLLVPNAKRLFHKLCLHEPIARLATLVKPDLTLVDGIVGIEGNGPGTMGMMKKAGMLVGGKNVVEVDSACCKIMGIDPSKVMHIKMASELGIGPLDADIVGDEIEAQNFLLPYGYHQVFKLKLWWTPEACSGCSSLIGEFKKSAIRTPGTWLKLFFNGVLRETDLVIGGEVKDEKLAKRVLCIGDCTREFAAQHGYCFVPGCPPKVEEVLNAFSHIR